MFHVMFEYCTESEKQCSYGPRRVVNVSVAYFICLKSYALFSVKKPPPPQDCLNFLTIHHLTTLTAFLMPSLFVTLTPAQAYIYAHASIRITVFLLRQLSCRSSPKIRSFKKLSLTLPG